MRRVAFYTLIIAGVPVANAFAAASVDISVQGGSTGIVVYSGTADVCNLSGSSCSAVEAGCQAALVSEAGVSAVGDVEKTAFVQENFPFAVNQEGLQADFQVATGLCNPFPPDIELSPDEPDAIPGSPG